MKTELILKRFSCQFQLASKCLLKSIVKITFRFEILHRVCVQMIEDKLCFDAEVEIKFG